MDAVKDEKMVVLVTLVYLGIFYSPRDIIYDGIKLVPIYCVICTLKEILRAKKVYKGLKEGREAMPLDGSPLFIPVLIATLKGNGSGFAGMFSMFSLHEWILRFWRANLNFQDHLVNLKFMLIFSNWSFETFTAHKY